MTNDGWVWRFQPGSRCLLVAALVLTMGAAAAAQPQEPCPCPEEEPEAPPPVWTGSIGAGISATAGNTDTSTYNVGFELNRDPQTRTVFKTDGLLLRGSKDGDDTVDRLTLNGRVEYTFNERVYAFGQLGYLRDQFKEIDYFLAPLAGIGYKVLDSERARLNVDAGLGATWEKNPGLDVKTEASFGAAEKYAYHFNDTASITHGVAALWTVTDFGDALYTINVGIAAGVTSRIQLKVEVLENYKTQPPDEETKKSDVAFLTSIVYRL